MNRTIVLKLAAFVLLVGVGVGGRLMEHAPNFTPIVATGLLAGVVFASRWAAMAVPMTAMAVSDAFIGAYEPRVMAVVYAAMLCPVLLRGVLRRRLTPVRVGASAAGCSALFFVSTNVAHWLFFGMYPMTAAGLGQCLAAGLPFLKYQLAGDLFWSAALFGGYAALRRLTATARPGTAPAMAA